MSRYEEYSMGQPTPDEQARWRNSRLHSQIPPMSPPAQAPNAVFQPQIYRATPVPTSITVRRPAQPLTFLINAPGLLYSPHTPENLRRFPTSPYPRAATRTGGILDDSPVPGPRIEEVPDKTPVEAVPADDLADTGPSSRTGRQAPITSRSRSAPPRQHGNSVKSRAEI